MSDKKYNIDEWSVTQSEQESMERMIKTVEPLSISQTQQYVEWFQKLEELVNFKGEAAFDIIRLLLSGIDTLNGYQEKANSTAIYPGKGTFVGLMYVTMKGCGESGEFAENVGKALRDDGICVHNCHDFEQDTFIFDQLSEERKEKLILELGDRLWYVAQAATELGVTLSQVAERNANKLQKRKQNDTLKGEGDNR